MSILRQNKGINCFVLFTSLPKKPVLSISIANNIAPTVTGMQL